MPDLEGRFMGPHERIAVQGISSRTRPCVCTSLPIPPAVVITGSPGPHRAMGHLRPLPEPPVAGLSSVAFLAGVQSVS